MSDRSSADVGLGLPARYDLDTIHSIVNTALVAHVSFAPDPEDLFPAILPMIGAMGSFEDPSAGLDEPLDCYLHGYVSSRIMNLAEQAVSSGAEGLPVCVAATRVDGLVLSLTPFSHSYNYRSAVLHGYATLVTSDEEKLWAMELITNTVVADRYGENTRVPPDKAEMSSTRILRIKVVDGSGKIRQGMPHDDKKDMDRDEITSKVWTGVVPVWERMGGPIPSSYNRVQDIPTHVRQHMNLTNDTNQQYAIEAAHKP